MSYLVQIAIPGDQPTRLIFDYAVLPGEEDAGHVPVMSFCRVTPTGNNQYMIPLASAYQFVKTSGYPTSELIPASMNICSVLGYDLTAGAKTAEVVKIADKFLNGLSDLLRMPPYERYRKEREEEARRKTNPGDNPREVVQASIQIGAQDPHKIEIVNH